MDKRPNSLACRSRLNIRCYDLLQAKHRSTDQLQRPRFLEILFRSTKPVESLKHWHSKIASDHQSDFEYSAQNSFVEAQAVEDDSDVAVVQTVVLVAHFDEKIRQYTSMAQMALNSRFVHVEAHLAVAD